MAAGDSWDDIVAAAKAEGEVHVDFVTNAQDVEGLEALWAQAYPEIALTTRRDVSGPMAAIEDEEIAAGRADFDVVMNADPPFLQRWVDAGNFLDVSDLPCYAELPDGWGNTYWMLNYIGPFTFVYNTDNVSADELPDSYEGLLDPKWNGRIGISDPASGSGTQRIAAYNLYKAYGEEFFTALAANNPSLYGSVLDMGQAVASGEIDVAIGGSSLSVVQLSATGAPLAVHAVAHSTPTLPGWGIYSGTPRENASKVFLCWIVTSDEAQTWWEQTARLTSRLWGTTDKFGDVHPAYGELTVDHIDFPDLAEYGQFTADGGMDRLSAILGF